jgi:DtxR family transcriptional regulator, manganese transport regulator
VVKIGELMSAKRSENPHQRTRKDHATETAEDYVEAIAEILADNEVCRANDLARRFAVSHVTVHRIVTRLEGEGLLTTEPYKPIQLTAKGKRIAKASRERHELVYQFLLAIGVDPEIAEKDAEGIEHHASPNTLERFRKMIEELT